MVNQINSNIVGCPIDIGEKVLDTMFHLITSMLWGDLFPALAMFDIQGMVRKMKKAHLWFDRTFDSVIDQRLKIERGGKVNFDIGKKEEHKTPFTITHIKALFLTCSLGPASFNSSRYSLQGTKFHLGANTKPVRDYGLTSSFLSKVIEGKSEVETET
ncbi:hypothetical protein IFM89_005261 [Coptis chinensis]|uniref:Cytochrome P450 n=1 Tax=Coptis chinensis TaxID=261450 RepID=A0A835ME53_9MAGN|nr:hypothetical protein IFM89_005261 [Coptis chinensis]